MKPSRALIRQMQAVEAMQQDVAGLKADLAGLKEAMALILEKLQKPSRSRKAEPEVEAK